MAAADRNVGKEGPVDRRGEQWSLCVTECPGGAKTPAPEGGARPKAANVRATHTQTHTGDSRKKERVFPMQGQFVALEPLAKNLHHTPRILLRFEVDNEAVGITDQICPTPQPRLHFLLEPEIQHVV